MDRLDQCMGMASITHTIECFAFWECARYMYNTFRLMNAICVTCGFYSTNKSTATTPKQTKQPGIKKKNSSPKASSNAYKLIDYNDQSNRTGFHHAN